MHATSVWSLSGIDVQPMSVPEFRMFQLAPFQPSSTWAESKQFPPDWHEELSGTASTKA